MWKFLKLSYLNLLSPGAKRDPSLYYTSAIAPACVSFQVEGQFASDRIGFHGIHFVFLYFFLSFSIQFTFLVEM